MCEVQSVVYADGKRVPEVVLLEETFELAESRAGFAWIDLYEPDYRDLDQVAREFDLHRLAVEDTVKAHQRAKIERYGDTLFLVLKTATYLDEPEVIEFGELHVFAGPHFVVTVRHGGAPDLEALRDRVEQDPDLLRHGPPAVLYAILDWVVDGYAPVVVGLENDIDEIEEQVFSGNPNASRRVYELLREVLEFERSTSPLGTVVPFLVAQAASNGDEPELQRYLRDVEDHVTRTNERVEGFRMLLQNILSVNLTLVSLAQNEDVKKISSWAAILFAPTLVGTIYGMNFRHMPELDWRFGYPFAFVMMGLVCSVLYLVFRRRGWL